MMFQMLPQEEKENDLSVIVLSRATFWRMVC
jgi:hypothetical protein